MAKNRTVYQEVGSIQIPLPKQPPLKEMSGYGLPKKQQKWTPVVAPTSFKRTRKDGNGNILYTKEQQDFIDREQNRIITGFWFINNGEPTYITGLYYAELTYWKIDIGLKEYRDRDRRVHLHWDYCAKDDSCFGVQYLKHRREGATHRACAINYFTTIMNRNSHSGIHSKTGQDASGVFKKLVSAWRKLPIWLQPVHEGTTFPKKSLSFFEPAERIGKNNKHIKQSEALESWIDFVPTNEEAYDGNKLLYLHLDEAGKITEANVEKMWMIVRECLNIGNRIIGKCYITSTVGEMEKAGGKAFRNLWRQSNPNDRDDNGRTTSGLYKLFLPAFDGLEGFIDVYGMSMEEEAKTFLSNRRKSYKKAGDNVSLAEFKRLYPFSESEALAGGGSESEFDLERINTQLEYLESLPLRKKPYVTGNLVWKNGVRDTTVVFQPSDNGRFKIAWRPNSEDEMNQVKKIATRIDHLEDTTDTYERAIYKPMNDSKFCMGVDPYDFDTVKHGKGSLAGAYIYKKFDLMEENQNKNGCFVLQYLHRPPLAIEFYEDMIKTCVYYGCQMLFENQKRRIKDYFENRGYYMFLAVRPKMTEFDRGKKTIIEDIGQSASTQVTQQLTELMQEEIHNNYHKIYFEELLEQSKEFNPADTEKSDAVMAAGYTLLNSRRVIKREPPKVKATSLFSMFDNSGSESRFID